MRWARYRPWHLEVRSAERRAKSTNTSNEFNSNATLNGGDNQLQTFRPFGILAEKNADEHRIVKCLQYQLQTCSEDRYDEHSVEELGDNEGVNLLSTMVLRIDFMNMFGVRLREFDG
jgi:hypothetical protein